MAGLSAPASARQKHWDAAYQRGGTHAVSWFQPTATVSLELFDQLAVSPEAAVLDIGGGASTLADALTERGYRDLSVLDVSRVALEAVRRRLGGGSPVALVEADLLSWKPRRRYDVWHDRAVLHFLVDDGDRARYLQVLRASLRAGGVVILATFAPDGPERCSGLPVCRYSASDLADLLGPGFHPVVERREDHVTPTGAVQPFTWVAGTLGDDPEVLVLGSGAP